jgi:CDP-paratose 2-epimerase
MPYVLITGSSGLVGSESAIFFLKKGFKVIGIDNNFRESFFGKDGSTLWIKNKLTNNYKNYYHFNKDIRDKKFLKIIFKKFSKKIRLIIHCAAQPSHDFAKYYSELDFSINAIGTFNLLELTRIFCKKVPFIYMSTNKVYGDNPNKLKFIEKKYRWEVSKKNKHYYGIEENFSIDNCTHSFFGVSKTYADLLVQEYGRNYGLNTVCFRSGCVTGPNHSGVKLHGFLSYLVKQCITKLHYLIIGHKGKQVRDNIHSFDLVKCFWEFYKNPKKGVVYNIGGGRLSNCSIIEAIRYIEKKKNIKIKISYNLKSRTGDHIWYLSNNKKFKRDYPDWKQLYSTKKILNELIDKY